MSRLVLIDGNAILHRAYHAIPHLTSSEGEPTNAVYGFVAILLRVINDLKPTHLAVAFDRPKPTFRKELYKDYQAQRPEMEDALVSQVEKVHRVVTALKIPIYEKDGYEADDVIATIAMKVISTGHAELVSASRNKSGKPTANFEIPKPIRQAQGPEFTEGQVRDDNNIDEVVIVTGDRDLLQLVNDRVKLFMPVKGLSEGKLFGEKEAEERMGVKPSQVADYKALAGDASDNYPGVAGIGPKTACSLLARFGSLRNLYKNLAQVENSGIKARLEKDRENALLSYKLATVVTDVPVEFNPNVAQIPGDLLTQKVVETFGELGFKTLLNRLSKMSQKDSPEEKSVLKKNSEQMGLF